MSEIFKYPTYFLLITLISCTSQTPNSKYRPVDSYDLDGNRTTLVVKNIVMKNATFTNTVTNNTVTVLHHLKNTSFHFYNAVAFKSDNEGIIVGGTGLKIRTTKDGGLHWKENSFSKFANAFHSISFTKENVFVVGEDNYIYRSNNFGENWEVFNTSTLIENGDIHPKYYKIKFYNNTLGIITGTYNNKATLLKTLNGGESWNIVVLKGLQDTESGISDFKIVSEKTILIVTLSGSCYKSIDGGTTWKLIFNDNTVSLNSIDFLNENEGYIGGSASILLYTEDGGNSWKKIDLFSKEDGVIYYQKFADEYKRIPPNKYSINISNIKYLDKNTTGITLANSDSDIEKDFLYIIEKDTETIKTLLSKKDSTVFFRGESYGLQLLKNSLFVLDRNNLYRIDLK